MNKLLIKMREIIAKKIKPNKEAPITKEKKSNKVRRNKWGFPVRGD